MLELALSYSLQDFLLFSPEIWWILYSEFSRVWWLMGVALSFLILLTIVKQKQILVLLTPLLLLLSTMFYYRVFYLEINRFANYLAVLCAVQFLFHIVWCWRKRIWISPPQNQFVRSHTTIRSGYVMGLFLSSVTALVIGPGAMSTQNDTTTLTLFLPGLQALVSALFLMFISRRYLRISQLYLVPISIVVAIEILTFYVMGLPFWWIGVIAASSALLSHEKS